MERAIAVEVISFCDAAGLIRPIRFRYEDEEQEEQNTWKICGEIVDRVTKIAIRLMRESYGQCMKENIIELLKYLKFELETVNENT